MNQALTVGLDFARGPIMTPMIAAAAAGSETGTSSGSSPPGRPRPTLAPIHGGIPGASGPLGRCALVYMYDCLVHSPTLEQHLLDVEEVLEIFRLRQLYAKSSKCELYAIVTPRAPISPRRAYQCTRARYSPSSSGRR